jgi:hypothetical protein
MKVGSRVRCKATCRNNDHHPVFQWYNGTGDGKWTRIDSATSADYVCSETDAGLYLLCCVEPVNAQGWRGPSISAASTHSVNSGLGIVHIIVKKNRGCDVDKPGQGSHLTTQDFPRLLGLRLPEEDILADVK